MGKALAGGESFLHDAVRKLENSPKLEEKVRKILAYRPLDPANRPRHMAIGSLLGAGSGAAAGAAASDDGSRLQGSLRGALLGAGTGAAAGRYAPRAAQYGVGRVVTNLVDPHIYDGAMHFEMLKSQLQEMGPKALVRAVLKDQPIHPIEPARHALFRDFFGMKRYPGTEDVITDLLHTPKGKISVFNPASAEGQRNLRDVDAARLKSLAFDKDNPAHQMQLGKTTLLREGAMSNFSVEPSGAWRDTWDFELHPGEKVNKLENLLRAAISPFGTPTTLHGKTLSQADVIRQAAGKPMVFEKGIHHSFTDPVLNRGIRGANVNPSEFMPYLRSELKKGDPTFLNEVANHAEGKPFNILKAFANKEQVSPSDMRVLLGGQRVERPRQVGAPKFDTSDLTAMFAKRIAGSNPQKVAGALSSMSAKDLRALRSRLTEWSKNRHPQGGELKALADTLGFAPDELPIRLQ